MVTMREWCASLEDRDDLVVIDDPVSTEFEIAAYINKSCHQAGPAFRFTNVENHSMDVIGSLFGAKRRMLEAYGADTFPSALEKYRHLLSNLVAPESVDSGPVCEVIDSDPDLNALPIVKHSEHDAGYYITGGVLVADLPHTGARGQSINRLFRIGSDELTGYIPKERRIGYAYRKRAEDDESTELAIVIGAPPSVVLGSLASVPHDIDKYDVAGAIEGRPIELVSCETIDVEVPAEAELVIEAVIQPNESVPEAPFGEYPGSYADAREGPLIEVTGIMHREEPLYQTILTGFPPTENNWMHLVPKSTNAVQAAERGVQSADQVKQAAVKCRPSGGNGMFEVYVSIEKRFPGDPWNVMLSVLSERVGPKYCVVVDEDIDIFNDREMDFAISTRVQPQHDVMTFPNMVGGPLDPSASVHRHSEKMGIDATVPLDENPDKYLKVAVPGTEDVSW